MMTPPSGSASPAMSRSSEVLPVPLPPMTPMMAPLGSSKLRSEKRVRADSAWLGLGLGLGLGVGVGVGLG